VLSVLSARYAFFVLLTIAPCCVCCVVCAVCCVVCGVCVVCVVRLCVCVSVCACVVCLCVCVCIWCVYLGIVSSCICVLDLLRRLWVGRGVVGLRFRALLPLYHTTRISTKTPTARRAPECFAVFVCVVASVCVFVRGWQSVHDCVCPTKRPPRRTTHIPRHTTPPL